MPLIAAGVGGGLSAAGSIIGGTQASKAAKEALAQQKRFTEKAIAELQNVGIPPVEAMKIALESPKDVFKYVPQLEQEFPELKTQMESVTTDPRLAQAQAEALAGIQSRATGGLTAEEQADINALRRGTASQAAARDASILQNLEQRGMGGSGQELLMRQAASQDAAQQAAIDAENQAKLIAQRKMEALAQLGSMAQSQQGQQFEQAAQKASAADTIAQANRNLAARIQSTNVGAQNEAALRAAEMKQQLENTRASNVNTQEQYNKGLIQQDYQNRLGKAQAIAGAYTGAGQQALVAGQNAAANKQAMWSGIGQAGMGAAQLYGAASKNTSGTGTKTTDEDNQYYYDRA